MATRTITKKAELKTSTAKPATEKEAPAKKTVTKKVTEKAANAGDAQAVAVAYKDEVMEAMAELRKPADELEVVMPKEEWPMPTYGDLVFEL